MARRASSQAGYNLVILIMVLTVMNIFIAAMLPLWSTAIRREKEEELIFRGWQYAEAIRVFHLRYQRYPNKLEELLEVKPRTIRQLWKDPMTDDGKWGIIFQGQGAPLQAQPGQGTEQGIGPSGLNNPNGPGGQNPNDPEGPEGPIDGEGREEEGGFNKPGKGENVAIGPIVGVYSKSPKKSILIFFDHQRYDEWRFTEELLLMGQRQPGQPGIPGQITDLSTRWLGRPMQFLNQPPGGGMPQDGTMPDGRRPGIGPGGPNAGGRPGTLGPGGRPGGRRPSPGTSTKPDE